MPEVRQVFRRQLRVRRQPERDERIPVAAGLQAGLARPISGKSPDGSGIAVFLPPRYNLCFLRKPRGAGGPMIPAKAVRSEEHTSELQSHLNLVCRLLLEKKKQ